jgi:hypothetical protein
MFEKDIKEIMYLIKMRPIGERLKVISPKLGIGKGQLLLELPTAKFGSSNVLGVSSTEYLTDYTTVIPFSMETPGITQSSTNNKLWEYKQQIAVRTIPAATWQYTNPLSDVRDSVYATGDNPEGIAPRDNYRKQSFTVSIRRDNSGLYYTDRFYRWDTTTLNFIPSQETRWYILETADDLNYYNSTSKGNDIIDAYRFSINPQNIVTNFSKIVQTNMTSSGWSYQFWGDDIPSIDVQGRTKMMLPKIVKVDGLKGVPQLSGAAFGGNPILESDEYKSLSTLRQWYLESNSSHNPVESQNRIGFYYRGILYVGYFESFSITDDVAQLFVLNYSFKFRVQEMQDYQNYDFSKHISSQSLLVTGGV